MVRYAHHIYSCLQGLLDVSCQKLASTICLIHNIITNATLDSFINVYLMRTIIK